MISLNGFENNIQIIDFLIDFLKVSHFLCTFRLAVEGSVMVSHTFITVGCIRFQNVYVFLATINSGTALHSLAQW